MSPSNRGKSSPASVRAALLHLMSRRRHHHAVPSPAPPHIVGERSSRPPRALTSTLFVPESVVADWTGTAVYLFDARHETLTQAASYIPSGAPVELYEVGIVEDVGSWWVATAPQSTAPAAWSLPVNGGVASLVATGSIPTRTDSQPIVRPTALWWWIPDAAIGSSPYTPSVVEGSISGPAPLVAPPSSPVQVQILPDGVRVTFGTTGWNLAVAGNVVTLTAS